MYDSTACTKASMPEWAVTPFGAPIDSSGSTIPTRGTRKGLETPTFRSRAGVGHDGDRGDLRPGAGRGRDRHERHDRAGHRVLAVVRGEAPAVAHQQGDELGRVQGAAAPVADDDVGCEGPCERTGCLDHVDRQLGRDVGVHVHLEATIRQRGDDLVELRRRGQERVGDDEDAAPERRDGIGDARSHAVAEAHVVGQSQHAQSGTHDRSSFRSATAGTPARSVSSDSSTSRAHTSAERATPSADA